MEEPGHPLVKIAREAIREYLEKGEVIKPPAELTTEMKESHGAFVSLKMKDKLKGCIGTYEPATSCVAEEVIHNAISAATRDPRFMPVTLPELKEINISVDILTPPEPIRSISELDPKKYGVIVKSGYRRGLLLPDIEGVNTPEEQVEIAKEKAGIGYGEPVELFKFEVKRYK